MKELWYLAMLKYRKLDYSFYFFLFMFIFETWTLYRTLTILELSV